MWAATARFVYADDQTLNKVLPQLVQTIDSSSVKKFGASLQRAIETEQMVTPKQEHLRKFQGIFKQLSTGKKQKASPVDLAKGIEDALLENKSSAEKAARIANPAFSSLLKTLQRLANPATSEAAPVTVPPTTAPPSQAKPATQLPAANSEEPPAVSNEIIPATSLWTWIALVLSVLSLMVAFFKGQNAKTNYPAGTGSAIPSSSKNEVAFSDEQFKEIRKEVRKEIERAMNNLLAAAPRAVAIEELPPAVPVPVSISAPAPVEVTPPPLLRTLYANQQPIDGLFQRNSLAGAPASYTIFELTVDERSPDQARYVVTRNPAGHAGFIGSHHTILGGACTYPFPQGNVTRIVTEVPGLAQRTASGDWQVSQKAHIRFE